MRTKETTVYQFDELSDRAKERARDWYRNASANDFSDYQAESVLEDAARMADLLGINLRTRTVQLMGGGTRQEPQIYYSGFWSQGDGACFVGTYAYRKGSVKAIASEAPAEWKDQQTGEVKRDESNAKLNRIAQELQALQSQYFYRLTANVAHTGRYSHEHSTTIEVYNGENEADEQTSEALADLLRDFMRWIYRALEAEYEYQNSDETIDENIRANEYEFDEDGNRE